MTTRKRPEGLEWDSFVVSWAKNNHAGKVAMADSYGVSYDTAKHWISDYTIGIRVESQPTVSEPGSNTMTMLTTKPGVSKAIVLGDTHNPYQDNEAVAAVEKFIGEEKPDYIIYNGDINDFYQVSEFSKDPGRLGKLQDDINVTTDMFRRHREIAPDAVMFFVEGTHENRWIKYLQDKAPAVSKLSGASVENLYNLPTLGIHHVGFERGILVNGSFLILHGDIAAKHSSATAKQHYEKHGGSGMCNHTHRGGSFYKRDRFGTYGWWENFCLCRLDPDWIMNPNWQQGFSVVHFESSGRFFVEQVPILGGKFIYGGKIY